MTRLPIDVGQEAGAWVSVRTSPGPTEVVMDKRGSESAAGRSADEETGSDFHGHERRWAEIHRVRDRAEAAGSWESEWQDSKTETATSGCACREAERRRRQSTGPARPGAANPGGAEERAFPLTRLQAARGRGRGQQWASKSLPLQRAGAPPGRQNGAEDSRRARPVWALRTPAGPKRKRSPLPASRRHEGEAEANSGRRKVCNCSERVRLRGRTMAKMAGRARPGWARRTPAPLHLRGQGGCCSDRSG